MNFIVSYIYIYGMSSFPLTHIFQDGYCTTNQIGIWKPTNMVILWDLKQHGCGKPHVSEENDPQNGGSFPHPMLVYRVVPTKGGRNTISSDFPWVNAGQCDQHNFRSCQAK